MLLTCAKLCRDAYGGIQVGNHSFAIKDHPGVTIVAIAGTKNLENVMEDASVWPSRGPGGGLVHAGVMNAYREMEEAVMPYLPKQGMILFTGHSLGGGIALMFAEKFSPQAITFGCLKPYFRFSPSKPVVHTRVICNHDPIPKVPGIFYTHRAEPLVLRDTDHELVDISDHSIDFYIKLLQARIPGSNKVGRPLLCPAG